MHEIFFTNWSTEGFKNSLRKWQVTIRQISKQWQLFLPVVERGSNYAPREFYKSLNEILWKGYVPRHRMETKDCVRFITCSFLWLKALFAGLCFETQFPMQWRRIRGEGRALVVIATRLILPKIMCKVLTINFGTKFLDAAQISGQLHFLDDPGLGWLKTREWKTLHVYGRKFKGGKRQVFYHSAFSTPATWFPFMRFHRPQTVYCSVPEFFQMSAPSQRDAY